MRANAINSLTLACAVAVAALWGCRGEPSAPAGTSTDSRGLAPTPGDQQQPAANLIHPLQGVVVQYLLTPERCAAIGGTPGREFDVDPTGAVVLGNGNSLLRIAATNGGIQADRLAPSAPDSFALDGQGSILSVVKQYFGELEDDGFSRLVPLPYPDMRLMGSSLAGVTYVVGGSESQSHRVYAFFADGTLQIEAEVPEPVVAVADNRMAVYLASKHTLFRVTANGIDVVARLPQHLGDVTALAAAADDKELYFATEGETFVMNGLAAVAVMRDLGGIVHVRNDKVYVWSPARQILVSVSGLPELLAAAQSPS